MKISMCLGDKKMECHGRTQNLFQLALETCKNFTASAELNNLDF